MKKLIICLLITLTGLCGQKAISGVLLTGGTALDDATAQKYLAEICGAQFINNKWSIYNSTIDLSSNAGTVYFVEVNNYWKGDRETWNNEDQIKYGVKKISRVDGSSTQHTNSGTFYTYAATDVNKFFFMVARSTKRGVDSSSYSIAFDWYDEWSYVEPDASGNYPTGEAGYNALQPTYDKLKDGAPFPAPHSCASSLENNHYTALNGASPIDENGNEVTGYDFTAYFYLPDKITTTNYKADPAPYVFFYSVLLSGALNDETQEVDEKLKNKYTVTLDWTTAFDKYANNDVQKATDYTGMQEHYLIERSYDNSTWVTVSDEITVVGNGVTTADDKTIVDTDLKAFDDITKQFGYTVYYRITSYVEKTTDEDGNELAEPVRMSATTSNTVVVDIPGTVPFRLALAGKGASSYDPDAVTNTFTNTIISAESKVGEKITINNNTTLALYRVNADNTLGDAIITVNNTAGTTSLNDLAQLIDNTEGDGNNGTYKDAVTLPAGDSNTAAYQLKLVIPAAEEGGTPTEKFSNVLRINNPAIANASLAAHRSGYPDATTCEADNEGKEVFHNEVSFSAATKEIGSGYTIYRDGEEIAKVHYSEQGFRLEGTTGENAVYYQPDENGRLTYIDITTADPIAVGETGSGNAEAWGYAVAFFDDDDNSYGSQRANSEYDGTTDELAVNVEGTDLKAYLVQASNDIYVVATVKWTLPKAPSFADANPIADGSTAFEIYVSKSEEKTGAEVEALSEGAGFEKVGEVNYEQDQFTYSDLYTSAIQEANGKFTTAEELEAHLKTYKFYVKMTNVDSEIKNSQVVEPTPDAGAGSNIYTALEGIEAADMDVKVVNGVVEVNGVTGAIKVVNAAGAEVARAVGNGDVTKIEGLATGVYVVTAADMKPTKILIK